MNTGQTTKADSQGGATSQIPRGSELALAEIGRGTKAKSGGEVTGKPPKAGQVVDPGADLVGQRAAFKTELPHLAGEGADQTELKLKGNTSATW
jgi:hypothetical protein